MVSKERLIQASILSANGDWAMMERLLGEVREAERIQSLARVIAHLEGNQFDRNDIYLATTTPGQSYVGTFAGSDGANFFFRDEESQIFGRKSQGLKMPAKSGGKISFTAS